MLYLIQQKRTYDEFKKIQKYVGYNCHSIRPVN